MRILEIDAGNSRLKWRLLGSPTGPESGFLMTAPGGLEEALEQQLGRFAGQPPELIRIASVLGPDFAESIRECCSRLFTREPVFAKVQNGLGGIKLAYQEPSTLGVDRWLTMLAVRQLASDAACIVDCGSAMTIDLIDREGSQKGGYIVPGLRLMQRSLGEGTANLPHINLQARQLDPGTSTAEAINHGILNMAVGLLERIHNNCSGEMSWYLCGGDAKLLSSFITWPHKIEPDLVLDGLAIACEAVEQSLNR